MEAITNLTSAFMNLFYEGGKQFTSWVTGIIPLILMLLVFMNSLVAFIGQERVNRFAKFCTGNPLLRYLVLPSGWLRRQLHLGVVDRVHHTSGRAPAARTPRARAWSTQRAP